MKMGTMFVHVCNGCHTEKGLYITHKSILMKHQTNKQTNKHIQQPLTLAKTSVIYTNTCIHKCNYPLYVKKRRLTTLNVIHVTINAIVDFLKINAHDNTIENNLPIIQSYCTRQVTI